jgi:hypothetical protein
MCSAPASHCSHMTTETSDRQGWELLQKPLNQTEVCRITGQHNTQVTHQVLEVKGTNALFVKANQQPFQNLVTSLLLNTSERI